MVLQPGHIHLQQLLPSVSDHAAVRSRWTRNHNFLKQDFYTLHCQGSVGLRGFPDIIKENGQVVVVVQLAYIHLQHAVEGCCERLTW